MKRIFIISLLLISQTALADINQARKMELHDLVLEDCGACHGLTLKGSLGPSLLPSALHGKSRKYLLTTILDGHKNTAMPAWRGVLNKEEAAWIVKQLTNGTTGAPR